MGHVEDFCWAEGGDELREDVEACALDPAGGVDYQGAVGVGAALVVGEEIEGAFDEVGWVEGGGDGCDGVGAHLALCWGEGGMAEGGGEVGAADLGERDNAGGRVFGLSGVEVEDHHAQPGFVSGATPVGYEAVCQESSECGLARGLWAAEEDDGSGFSSCCGQS